MQLGPVPFCTCARAAVIAHYTGQAVRGVAVCGGVAHVSCSHRPLKTSVLSGRICSYYPAWLQSYGNYTDNLWFRNRTYQTVFL